MKKTKSKPVAKPRLRFSKKSLIIALAVLLMLIFQGVIDYSLWHNWNNYDPSNIRELVIQAGDNLYKRPAVDPKTGDIYFYEAQLYIPSPGGITSSLHYNAIPINDGGRTGTELYLSSRGWIEGHTKLYLQADNTAGSQISLKTFFDRVPEFQACSRQFMIGFDKAGASMGPEYQLSQSRTLASGRVLYLYANNKCGVDDSDFVTRYFLNLQSY